MYMQRIWKAGKTIDVMKTYLFSCQMVENKLCKVKLKKKSRPTPEQMRKYNQIQREREIIRIANENFAEGDLYLTLKYARGFRPTVEQAKLDKLRLLRALRDYCRKHGIRFKYIFTTEIGERGGIHHHMILGAMDVQVVERLWKRVTDGHGNVHFEFLYGNDFSKLAKYFVGERCTDLSEQKENSKEKRYSTSQGLVRPKASKPKKIPASSWREEPVAPKGYYVDKDSIYTGINPVTGYGYQFYRLIQLEPQTSAERRMCRPQVESA